MFLLHIFGAREIVYHRSVKNELLPHFEGYYISKKLITKHLEDYCFSFFRKPNDIQSFPFIHVQSGEKFGTNKSHSFIQKTDY